VSVSRIVTPNNADTVYDPALDIVVCIASTKKGKARKGKRRGRGRKVEARIYAYLSTSGVSRNRADAQQVV